jgi:signal transduction histidine kinase
VIVASARPITVRAALPQSWWRGLVACAGATAALVAMTALVPSGWVGVAVMSSMATIVFVAGVGGAALCAPVAVASAAVLDYSYTEPHGFHLGHAQDVLLVLLVLLVGAVLIPVITVRRRRAELLLRYAEASQRAELEARVRVRTAALEAANRDLEAFSYSVSHDLRTPLRAIDGYARIVLDDHASDLTPDGRRYLERVSTNVHAMGSMIDGLLAFSRLGQQQLDRRVVDVEPMARQVADDLAPTGEGRSVTISIGALAQAQADPALVRQVLANLVSNAVKYTRDTAQARIEIGSYDDGGATVYFVRDNGVGFDMRHAPQVFKVFHRLHRTEEYEGTGIGLALVARIVQRHGGRVWADASPGNGATFCFTLAA